MLEIKTGYKRGEAVTIVTENLSEMVGRFVSEDDENMVLSSVRVIMPQARQDGSVGISLQPLVYSAEDGHKSEMTFKKSSLLTHMKSMKNIDDTLREEDSGVLLK